MACPESFRGLRVLITGGGGFIASRLADRLLSSGAEVHLVIRTGSSDWRLSFVESGSLAIHKGDCADAGDVRRILGDAAPDLVFHLAVPRIRGDRGWRDLVSGCVSMAENLAEYLPAAGNPPLVVSGSSLEYGPSPRAHREDDPPAPATWHGLGKLAALGIFTQAARDFGLRFTNLRFFHVYGPWESPHRLLGTAIRASLTGEFLPVVDGIVRRDWVFIDDVVEACLAAARTEAVGETFNIGSGNQYSNEFIIETVETLCGRPIRRRPGEFPKSPSDGPNRLADISKAEKALGWIPRVSLEEGLGRTIGWLKDNPDIMADRPGCRPVHA